DLLVQLLVCLRSVCLCVFVVLRRPPSSTLFPYTTLFRSVNAVDLRTCTASFTEARYFLFRFSGFKRPCISTQRSLGAVLLRPLRSEEHTSELQSRFDLVCRLLLEKKNNTYNQPHATPPSH